MKNSKKIEQQFDLRSRTYNTYTPWINDQKLYSLCVPKSKTSAYNCLDCGGGTGYVASKNSKESNNKWTVIDLSNKMGELILSEVTFIKGDIHYLPFNANTFDFILIRSVLQYTDPLKVLHECHRVLKSNGTLILAHKVLDIYQEWATEVEKVWSINNPLKTQFWFKENFIEVLSDLSFDIKNQTSHSKIYTQNLLDWLSKEDTVSRKSAGEINRILEKTQIPDKYFKMITNSKFRFLLEWFVIDLSKKDET